MSFTFLNMKRYWHMACRFEEGVSKRLVVFFSQNETQRLQLLVIKWGPLFTFTPSIMYFCQDVDTPWQSVCVWAYECWPSYSHAVEYSQLPPFNLRWRKKKTKYHMVFVTAVSCCRWTLLKSFFLIALCYGSLKKKILLCMCYNTFLCTSCYSWIWLVWFYSKHLKGLISLLHSHLRFGCKFYSSVIFFFFVMYCFL